MTTADKLLVQLIKCNYLSSLFGTITKFEEKIVQYLKKKEICPKNLYEVKSYDTPLINDRYFKMGLRTMMKEVVESNIKTDREKLCEFFDLMKQKYKF